MILLPDGSPYEGPAIPDAPPVDTWEEWAAYIIAMRMIRDYSPVDEPDDRDGG